jgi:hypothetical protein
VERMWKEPVAAHFKGPSRHSRGETEEQHEKPRDRQRTDRESNRAPAECKSEALPPEPARSVRHRGTATPASVPVTSTRSSVSVGDLTVLYQLLSSVASHQIETDRITDLEGG